MSLSCATDDRYLRVSSADKYDVASRYDSVEFWLQPQTESFDALAGVVIKLAYDALTGVPAQWVPTSTEFPVVVARSRSRMAVKVAASAVGAFLVALPGILGQGSALPLRVVAAVAGALLIACAAIVITRPGSKLSLLPQAPERKSRVSGRAADRAHQRVASASDRLPLSSRALPARWPCMRSTLAEQDDICR